MGMYNYIGDGDQIKCFYVPYFSVKMDGQVFINTSGGDLKTVNDNIPYMTPFYNYGQNIMIMSYCGDFGSDDMECHIIRDGRYINTIPFGDLDSDFQLPSTVMDGHGVRYKVHNMEELHAMFTEKKETENKYDEYIQRIMQANNVASIPTASEAKEMSSEELNSILKTRALIQEAAYMDTISKFREKWIDSSHESDLEDFGMIYFIYTSNKDIGRRVYHDYEINCATRHVISVLRAKYENPVEAYLKWCEKEAIIIDTERFMEMINTHNSEPTEELKVDYQRYLNERGW